MLRRALDDDANRSVALGVANVQQGPLGAEGVCLAPLAKRSQRGQQAGQFSSESDPEVIALSVWGTAHGLVSLVLSGNEPPGLAVADCYERALGVLVAGWRESEGKVQQFADVP